MSNKLLFESETNYIQKHIGGKIDKDGRLEKSDAESDKSYIQNQLDLVGAGDKFLPPNLRYNFDQNYNSTYSNINTGLYNQPSDVNRYNISNESNGSNGSNGSIFANVSSFGNNNGSCVGGDCTGQRLGNTFSANNRKRTDVYMRGEENRYDPYKGYIYKQGLMPDGSNIRRYRTKYINVDSQFRQKNPVSILGDSFKLLLNPIKLTTGLKTVVITQQNHPFKVGDLIQIDNVIGDQATLRTINESGAATFVIPSGCNVMRINYPPGLPTTYTGSTATVTIVGVRGDSGNPTTNPILGNIPINVINTTHQVFMSVTSSQLFSGCTVPPGFLTPGTNHFYVLLPVAMQNLGPGTDPYVLAEYNFQVVFNYLAAVPLNYLNASYPLDPNHLQGFYVIRSTTTNNYSIIINLVATNNVFGGGSNVVVSQITQVYSGYPNPNNYVIDIGDTYHNIASIRMVSCEFPNTSPPIRDFPTERANNKIYWNDIDDGNILYSISVPPGSYTASDLVTTMEQLFQNTPRVNALQGSNSTYLSSHPTIITINQNTDEVTFQLFKEWCVILPFQEVTPDIVLDPSLANPVTEANTAYTITVFQPGHGMVNPGQTVLIQNAIDYKGIPASVLNGTHVVSAILDANTWQFILPTCTFNLLNVRTDSKGGAAVKILIPDIFRLLFNQPDTLGSVLGFRNPGDPSSIYNFSTQISNSDPYKFEATATATGDPIRITNNALQLSGDNYTLMTINTLETLKSIGPIKSVFAKILLCDIAGKVLFNTHANTSRIYEDTIHELSQLEVSFYSPDGFLYNFNGLDHSYIIEIVVVDDIPEGTGINADTGRNYNLVV